MAEPRNWHSSGPPRQVQAQSEYGSQPQAQSEYGPQPQAQSGYGPRAQTQSGYGDQAQAYPGYDPLLQVPSGYGSQDPRQELYEALELKDLDPNRLTYNFRLNNLNGVDTTVIRGKNRWLFNTNELRVIRTGEVSRLMPEQICDELWDLHQKAGRAIPRIPPEVITFLYAVMNDGVKNQTDLTRLHWEKVNTSYGFWSDKEEKSVSEEWIEPRMQRKNKFAHELEAEAEALAQRAVMPPPAKRQLSPPRPYQGRNSDSPSDNLMQPRSSRQGHGQSGSGSKTSRGKRRKRH